MRFSSSNECASSSSFCVCKRRLLTRVHSGCKAIFADGTAVYWASAGRDSATQKKLAAAPRISPLMAQAERKLLAKRASLQQTLDTLNKQLDLGEGCDADAARKGARIDRLHRYNDVKDAGQELMGRLAVLEGESTEAMYRKYDLELDD